MPLFRSSSNRRGFIFVPIAAVFCGILAVSSPLFAQLPQARLYAISPPGGQQGTTFDVSLANGIDLEDSFQLLFSHPGIKGTVKTQEVDGKPQPISGQFSVTIDPSVPTGIYDARMVSRYGVSTPRSFVVGHRPEAKEVEPNNETDKAQKIELNTVVNGLSNSATDLDFYKISLKKDERVVILCQALSIDSRMDPTLELYAPDGRLLQYTRNRIGRDPLIDLTAPADGDYVLKIYDFLYQGSNDYFYRLSVGRTPHVEFVLPPSGLPGTTGEYTLYGHLLPGGTPSAYEIDGVKLDALKVSVAMPQEPPSEQGAVNVPAVSSGLEGVTYRVDGPDGPSNPVVIHAARAALTPEVEPNNEAAQSQAVTVPVEIYGQFQERRDIDYYTFNAAANAVFWIEVFGQRNGSNADPYLIVEQVTKAPDGKETVKQLTALDDNAASLKLFAFDTFTSDPSYRFVAPAEGTYRVSVRDRYFESRGDARLSYRLAIRPEVPDYRLYTVASLPKAADQANNPEPWDLLLRKGQSSAIEVLCDRRDGFALPIEVKVEGLPAGVTASPAILHPGQTSTLIWLNSTDQAAPWVGSIKVVGSAVEESAAANKAFADAEALLNAAKAEHATASPLAGPVAALTKPTADAVAAINAAAEQRKDDPELAKLKEGAAKALAAINDLTQLQAAQQAALDKKLADATAGVETARKARIDAIRNIIREARPGTIVWNRGAAVPAEARLARDLVLAVNHETYPLQFLNEPVNLTVSQSSQVFLPTKIVKRGFDEPVAMAILGNPQNLALDVKPVPKGADSEWQRLFIAPNVAPGTYTMSVTGQTTVNYRRNPEAADAAAKAKTEADQALAAANETAKKAADAKAAADKGVVDQTAALKAATDEQAKAAGEQAAAEKIIAANEPKLPLADKLAVQTAETSKLAAEQLAAAQAALEKAKDDPKLIEEAATAKQLAEQTATAAASAQAVKDKLAKELADAKAAKETAVAAKAAADKKVTDTEKALADAKTAQAAADKQVADATALVAKTTADQKAAEAKAAETAKIATPANIVLFTPAAPVTITVKPGPATLAVAPANNGMVKKGEKVEVKVTVNRINNFAGPVTLSLSLPPNVAGLTAEPVTVAADAKEGTLVVTAAPEAPEGAIANVMVRGTVDFGGETFVDQPLPVTVTK